MAEQTVTPFLDESINKFKAEIISQDWSLSPKKIPPLQAAVSCLKNNFSGRRNLIAMLNMIGSVLAYAQRRKDSVSPEFVDFIKETMAHVVNSYEEETVDLEEEARLCKRVYADYCRLKEKASAEKDAVADREGHSSPEKAEDSSAALQVEKNNFLVKKRGGRIMNDQRRNTRVPFQSSATLDFPDKTHVACEITDLSLKGVFVHGVTGQQQGEICQISLDLSGSTSHLVLKMKGKVVRVEAHGLALHFQEMDLDSYLHLKNILYYNAEDPDALEDEFSASFNRPESLQ